MIRRYFLPALFLVAPLAAGAQGPPLAPPAALAELRSVLADVKTERW